MECFAAMVVLVLTIAFLAGATSRAQFRAGRRGFPFQQLAQRYQGNWTRGGFFGQPSVRFRYGATEVCISPVNTRDGRLLQATMTYPDRVLMVEVLPTPRGEASRSFRRLQEIGLGVEDFDRDYTVRGNDDDAVRHLLGQGVRWQIERLRHAFNKSPFALTVASGRMIVAKEAIARHFEDLDLFARLVLDVYDQAMLTRCVGIEFVDSNEAQIVSEAVCRICGDEITVDMVFCRRCMTPHHYDCWQYNGACSIYGCQETRFAVPTLAKPATEHDSTSPPTDEEKPKPR